MRISDWSSDVCSSDLSRDKESAQVEEQVNSQKSAAYRSIWRAVEQDAGDYRDGTEPVEFRNMASRGRTHLIWIAAKAWCSINRATGEIGRAQRLNSSH